MRTETAAKASLIAFLYYFTLINCQTENSTENVRSITREYVNKICNNTNTCHLLSVVPEEYRDLRVRNCMCDDECGRYNDCCSDAFVAASSLSSEYTARNFECVRGVVGGDAVYMITKCPQNPTPSATVREYCEGEDKDLLAVDVLLSTPVTTDAKLTFKNLFCALCHQQKNFTFWNLHVTYEPVKSEPVAFANVQSSRVSYDADTVLKNLSIGEEFYFKFEIDNTTYKLIINHVVPSGLKSKVRFCIPNAVNRCPATWKDRSVADKCAANYTSYTFTKNRVYKNEDCLTCNDQTGRKICRNEYENEFRNMANGTEVEDWFEINIEDKRIRKVDARCKDIPEGIIVFEMFCGKPNAEFSEIADKGTEESSESNSGSIHNKCYPIRKDVNLPCLVNHIFANDEIRFINNETIYVYTTETNYTIEEFSNNGTHVYVCGTFVHRTRFQRIIEVLDDILTSVLIKVSMMCLVMQLILFQQLPELKNLSGKNLAAFCATLLVAFLCFDIGPWLPSCKITAAVAHYAFLSCFTWMLVMSYDCWLSLYRATSQFRAAGGKHKVKFALYCLICWSLPLVVVVPSVFIEITDTFGCTLKPGYGVSKECFIFGSKAQYVFFFLPASIMFLGNICFFVHTAYMIYHSQKSTVNPNTRNDFRLYTRLALLMGLTWTLGSLAQITENVIIGLAFSIMNMSQGMFIFFGFTFKKKTLRSFLEKHKDSRLLSTTLSGLVAGAEPTATATTMTTDIKAHSQTDGASGQL